MTDARLRVLVVDDEEIAREGLAKQLGRHADLEVIGLAKTGAEAVTMIGELEPELVFLDIRMPEGDGFEVLKSLGEGPLPLFVFVTAHADRAVEAFDAEAVDYLLKPFDPERLDAALDRVRERRSGPPDDRWTRLFDALPSPTKYRERFVVRAGTRLLVVPTSELVFVGASGNYVELHSQDHDYLLREPLSRIADELDPADFVRVHRSFIVRISAVRELLISGGGEQTILLSNGERLPLGRKYRPEFEARLDR